MLPHLLHNTKYLDFYRERRADGNYIILDNGAAEGVDYGQVHLHTLAKEVEANEIVIPDVLEDTVGTISRAKAFVPYAEPDFKYMAVLQGTTQQEVLKCLSFFDHAPDQMHITCIGIPRVLNKVRKAFRLHLTEFLISQEFHRKFQFHFLGMSNWIREPAALSATVEGCEASTWDESGFRGIDTSLPIYMGLKGYDIGKAEYIERPVDYFDMTFDRYEQVMININQYLGWAVAPERVAYGQD